MKKQLNQLIVERYKYFLLGVTLLIIGVTLFETRSNISNWKEVQTELSDKKAEKEFYKDLKNTESYPTGKMTVFYDNREGRPAVDTDDFKEYKNYRLEVFHDDPNVVATYPGYASESMFLLLLVAIISGFVLFFYDNKTNFNTLLFSSKFRRRDIYFAKYKIVAGSLLLALIISKVMRILSFMLFIPSEHLNASFLELLPSQILQITALALIFSVSSFAGIILGEWITGVVTLFGFWYMLTSFVVGVFSVYSNLINRVVYYEFIDVNLFLQLAKNNTGATFLYIMLFLAASLGMFFWGMTLYDRLSLEKNGNYLMFDFLRKPTQVIFLIYVFFATSGSSLIDALKIQLTGNNHYGDYQPSIIENLIATAIIMSVAYIISSITIYRKNPFSFLKKEK